LDDNPDCGFWLVVGNFGMLCRAFSRLLADAGSIGHGRSPSLLPFTLPGSIAVDVI
jgi:hypothetical protein